MTKPAKKFIAKATREKRTKLYHEMVTIMNTPHKHIYPRSMDQKGPRLCAICKEPEKTFQQAESSFTEEQLTPLEKKFAEAKANRDAGVEPFKIVPLELWDDIMFALTRSKNISTRTLLNMDIERTLEKMKQL